VQNLPPSSQVLGGVDILYLKNVVLKFMEAVTAGKVAERDALLPAVATLLQVGFVVMIACFQSSFLAYAHVLNTTFHYVCLLLIIINTYKCSYV